jgi:uncharacterized protein (TIGR02217 family)
MKYFHNINLPRYLEQAAIGQPLFNTLIASSQSGRENRMATSDKPKSMYDLTGFRLSRAQFHELKCFFNARVGRKYAFRFRDNLDYHVNKEFITKSDGFAKIFYLQKNYKDKISPYIRKITKFYAKSLKVYANESLVKVKIMDELTGKIELENKITKGSIISADFEFDVIVRFNSDNIDYSFEKDGSICLKNLQLIEVFE